MLCALLRLASSSAQAAPQPSGVASSGRFLLWNNSDGNGAVSLAINTPNTSNYVYYTYGPYPGWRATTLAAGADGVARILWTKTDGSAALWRVDASGNFTHFDYGPFSGWTARGLAVGSDNVPRILWTNTSGQISLWSVNAQGGFTFQYFGPYTGYTASLIAVGADNAPRILWNKTDGSVSLWRVDTAGNFTFAYYGPFYGYAPLSLAADSGNAVRLLWNHPADSTVSLWNIPPGGSYSYQYYPYPIGYDDLGTTTPPGVSADVSAAAGNAQVLYGQSDGTAQINFVNNSGQYSANTVAPPGASTGGGTGGGTGTATPNPHGYYSVIYTSSANSSTSTDGATGITAPVTTFDAVYGDMMINGSSSFSNTQNGQASAHFGATLTANFTWHGDTPNSPPPAQVTVVKRAIATVSTAFYSNISYSFNSGLGVSHGTRTTPGNYDTATDFASEVKGGSSFSVSCSPTADVHGTGGGNGDSASARASFTAVALVMNLAGTTLDANGIDNILIGQGCTASLRGSATYPPGFTYTVSGVPVGLASNLKYAWDVSGFKFQNWVVQEQLTTRPYTSTAKLSSGLGTSDQATAHWYWSDKSGGNNTPSVQTVKFAATLQSPTGSSFNMTFSDTVGLLEPVVDFNGMPGRVQLNNKYIFNNPSVYGVYAGPGKNGSPSEGVVFTGLVTTPPLFSGSAVWNFVQLVKPGIYETPNGGTEVGSRYNNIKMKGLDTTYPYEPGPYQAAAGGYSADITRQTVVDSPGIATLNTYSNYRIAQSYTMLHYVSATWQ